MSPEAAPSVAAEIDRIVASVPGWTPPDQLLALAMLATVTGPLGGDVLEIGSWCGRSTAVLGHAARRSGGHVFAVDLFPRADEWRENPDGSFSMRARIDGQEMTAYTDQTVWREPFLRDIAPIYAETPDLLDRFNATIEAEGLTDVVTPFRGDAAQWITSRRDPPTLRLAFIDGDHGYDAVCRDIALVGRHLQPGGWIAFDDAFSHYEGVDRAITEKVIRSDDYEAAHQVCRKLFVARRAQR